ncbi:reverse transcriptase domain-containing protein, partial [Tanacetum coccineum]
MLERLSGNEYYCFLDGLSGYFQIPLALEDQEKTTFTCMASFYEPFHSSRNNKYILVAVEYVSKWVEAEALPTNDAQHKAYWALRNVNLDLDTVGKHRYLQLNELAELRNKDYEHSRAYKERTKRWHDAKIMDKEFHEGEEVLVFNSKLKLFPGKLKSRWYGPYTVRKDLSAKKSNLKSSRLIIIWFKYLYQNRDIVQTKWEGWE